MVRKRAFDCFVFVALLSELAPVKARRTYLAEIHLA